jgi:hypothetical protein
MVVVSFPYWSVSVIVVLIAFPYESFSITFFVAASAVIKEQNAISNDIQNIKNDFFIFSFLSFINIW